MPNQRHIRTDRHQCPSRQCAAMYLFFAILAERKTRARIGCGQTELHYGHILGTTRPADRSNHHFQCCINWPIPSHERTVKFTPFTIGKARLVPSPAGGPRHPHGGGWRHRWAWSCQKARPPQVAASASHIDLNGRRQPCPYQIDGTSNQLPTDNCASATDPAQPLV